jgi:hypothetical protein
MSVDTVTCDYVKECINVEISTIIVT